VIRANILVVDDDPVARKLMSRALKRVAADSRVDLTSDGRSALAFLAREGLYSSAPPPDLLLLDWNLPDHHGSEVLARVRQSSALRDLPVVIVSGSDAPEDMEKARTLGSNGYVVKHADFARFTEALRAIIEPYLVPREPEAA